MDRAVQPPVHLIENLTLPQVELVHLDNGVPVYLINAGEQEVIKIELLYKAGKWYEPKNLTSDLANRMLREGTTGHSAKQIADIFDYYGANINYGAAFETGGAVLYSLTKQVSNVLPLLHEIFTQPVFPQHEFDTIANNRKQRLTVDLEKNDFIANRRFVDALYGQKHPYGRITQFEDFDNLNTADLQEFFSKHYNTANLTIIISGKFTGDVVTQLNRYFGTKTSDEKATGEVTHPVESSATLVHHVEKANSVQSAIMVGNLSINKNHPDFLKISILNTVFGGYFGSRLMKNIREEKGYTYGIYSAFVSYPHGGFFEISSEVGKQVREATLTEIEKEINILRNEPISAEELQTVKNYMSGKIMRSIDGPLKFSETLKGLLVYNQTPEHILEILRTVREITAAEIQELAVKHLDYSKMYKVTVG